MLTKNFEYQEDRSRLCEDEQAVKLRTALCTADKSGTISNIMPFVKCRDYYSDILYCQSYNVKNFKQYGFHWSYQPTLNRLRVRNRYMWLAVKADIAGKQHLGNLTNKISLLNEAEDVMGLQHTKVYATDDNKIILLKFPSTWMRNSVLMNFYTLLIRIAASPYELKGDTFIEKMRSFNSLKKIVDTNHGKDGSIDKEAEKLVTYYTDIKLVVRITENNLFEQLLYNWRQWCGDFKQPVKYDDPHIYSGTIHRSSCLLSLISCGEPLMPWYKKGMELLGER